MDRQYRNKKLGNSAYRKGEKSMNALHSTGMVPQDVMILGQDQYYSLDCHKTLVNNNVLVVGSPGSGKTRSIVTPNLLEMSGSYVISDPKGNLYNKWGASLILNGYRVVCIDFTHPEKSSRYNPFRYIRSDEDTRKMAHLLIGEEGRNSKADPFWDLSSELLVQSLLLYLIHEAPSEQRNFHGLMDLLSACDGTDEQIENETLDIDVIMNEIRDKENSTAYRLFRKVRMNPEKTLRCVLTATSSHLSTYDTPALNKMMRGGFNLAETGRRKTALFVVVSDTDRSMDALANIFFTQTMQELCYEADARKDSALQIPVRFILDDFATNVKIEQFPRMIASIRSRGISTMLMIQSEAQLAKGYQEDADTIIGSCDSYVYLGGNDVKTAKNVAERCNMPLRKIFNMPVGTSWIFRRGQEPVNARTFDLESCLEKDHGRDKANGPENRVS